MKIKYLIIHHTATSRDRTTFEAVKRYHISKGWGDIGYHFFITADGVLHEGRKQDKVGAHCRASGMNYKSLGIALTGNFQIEHPTEKQLETLKGIVSQLKKIWDIPIENILGHRQVKEAKTVCPGNNLIMFVESLREVVNEPVEATGELLITIKEQRQEIGQLKLKLNRLEDKYNKQISINKELKVALESQVGWFSKQIKKFYKNG